MAGTAATAKMLTATLDRFSSSLALTLTPRCRGFTCSAAATAAAPRIAVAPPDLIRWIRREGGFVHPKIKIADHPSLGLGLVATGEIPRYSELISLPSHLLLHFDADGGAQPEHEWPLFRIAAMVPEELWAMKLGLRLLQERAKVGSFWWPYISNLPEAFTVPIFFSGEEIRNMQYAPLVYQVNKRCRFLLDFDTKIKEMLENMAINNHPFGGQTVNASSLGWAMSAVSSRAFRLYGNTVRDGKHSEIPMLLPLIDMCNHSFNPNARIVQEQGGGKQKMLVKVVAETPIECDSSVLLNYGCLSNDFFLLDYGFVIPENPYDLIELKYDEGLLDAASVSAGVSSPTFSSPNHWQQEILRQLNLNGEAALLKVNLGGSEVLDGRLLAALRVLLASDKESVQKHDLNVLKSFSEEAPLGVDIETATLRTLISLCVIVLDSFPTKIMQDESMLKGNISSSMELAVKFRMQKKITVIDVIRKLTQKIKKLSKEISTPVC